MSDLSRHPARHAVPQHYETAHPTGTGNAADSKNLVCDLCEKTYVSKRGLVHHMKFAHSVDSEQHKIVCGACGQKYRSLFGLKQHTARAHGKSAADCFDGRSGRKPTKERKFVCDICDKGYTTKRCLLQHLRSVH